MGSVARGGTIVITGLTTGPEVKLALLPMLGDQITVMRIDHGDATRHEAHDDVHRQAQE